MNLEQRIKRLERNVHVLMFLMAIIVMGWIGDFAMGFLRGYREGSAARHQPQKYHWRVDLDP